YYYTDLPVLALWGGRLDAFAHPIADYFAQAEAGKLPRVVFVDPAFLGDNRTDDHPLADIRAGQRYLRDVFAAFARSKHWKRGAFVVMYDEWGGFYDHVRPPVLPDNRANPVDDENFGQAGFRVPALVASPCAQATPSGPGTAVRAAARGPSEDHAFEQAYQAGWFERVGFKVEPSPMAKRWAHG